MKISDWLDENMNVVGVIATGLFLVWFVTMVTGVMLADAPICRELRHCHNQGLVCEQLERACVEATK